MVRLQVATPAGIDLAPAIASSLPGTGSSGVIGCMPAASASSNR
jgi:hypothetical protein